MGQRVICISEVNFDEGAVGKLTHESIDSSVRKAFVGKKILEVVWLSDKACRVDA